MKRYKLVTHVRAVAGALLAAGLVAGCEGAGPVEPEPVLTNAPTAARVPAHAYGYTVIDVPGATSTQVYRMNARGDVVGSYFASGWHGFVLRQGELQTIDFPSVPSANATQVRGINDRGDVVGFYNVAGKLRGFLLGEDGFMVIEYPDANGTRLWGINPRGEISGEFQAAAGGAWRTFTLRAGTFTPIDVPDANMSAGYDINTEGDVVGHFTVPGSARMLGYRLAGGMFTYFDHPASLGTGMSCAQGIGVHGEVLGHYYDPEADEVYGYVWLNGEFVARLQPPDATQTYPTSITPTGVIAGYHVDGNGASHGFIAEPLNPAGW
jgi:hypothetical protein